MLKSKLVTIRGMELLVKLTKHAIERSDLRYVEADLVYDSIESAYETILDDSKRCMGKYPNFVIYNEAYRISCACELQVEGMNVITVCMGVLEPNYPQQKVFEVDKYGNVLIKKGADYL